MAYLKGSRSVEISQGWDLCNREFSDYFKQKSSLLFENLQLDFLK